MTTIHPLAADLDHVLAYTGRLWEQLRGQRIFITGGTGFFGAWLLESFLRANEAYQLGASALVLTRNPEAFARTSPLASHPAIALHPGDIRDFQFPAGRFSHIIHAAATSAVATFNHEDPLAKFDTVAGGTRRVLDFAVHCGAGRFLLTSSGSVYGRQPAGMTHVPEDYPGAPDPALPASALGEGKRAAEFLCHDCARKHPIEVSIARCFSFIGPHLQLDIHYAIGNFLRDAANGGPIRVRGDGTARRSYLHAADLMIWLWTLLFQGENGGVYNVGSEREVSIADLAGLVASQAPGVEVLLERQAAPGQELDRYVPSVRRARERLGLRERIPLEAAIRSTLAYLHSSLK